MDNSLGTKRNRITAEDSDDDWIFTKKKKIIHNTDSSENRKSNDIVENCGNIKNTHENKTKRFNTLRYFENNHSSQRITFNYLFAKMTTWILRIILYKTSTINPFLTNLHLSVNDIKWLINQNNGNWHVCKYLQDFFQRLNKHYNDDIKISSIEFLIEFSEFIQARIISVNENLLVVEKFVIDILKEASVFFTPNLVYYLYSVYSPFVDYSFFNHILPPKSASELLFPPIDVFMIYNFLYTIDKKNCVRYHFSNKLEYPSFEEIFPIYINEIYEMCKFIDNLNDDLIMVEDKLAFMNTMENIKKENIHKNLHFNESLKYHLNKKDIKLTNYQNSAIIGIILGDGCIRANGQLEFKQSIIHNSYYNYCVNIFCNIECVSTKYNGNYNNRSQKENKLKLTNKYFIDMRKKWYANGTKQVPDITEYFNEITLINWIGDDGTRNGNTITLCTHNFNAQSIKVLFDLLKNVMKIEKCKIKRMVDSQVQLIQIKYEEVSHFEKLQEHFPLSMMYKIDPNQKKTVNEILNNTDVYQVKQSVHGQKSVTLTKDCSVRLCRYCGETFTNALNIHYSKHLQSAECRECGMFFGLYHNVTSHNTAKKYGRSCIKPEEYVKCDTCGRWFNTIIRLANHAKLCISSKERVNEV